MNQIRLIKLAYDGALANWHFYYNKLSTDETNSHYIQKEQESWQEVGIMQQLVFKADQGKKGD